MKVGIVKGLLYYYDEVLWENFFDNLNVKTIKSSKVTKQTIKDGELLLPDEACLSLKIFMGQVKEIKDKCDLVFIPHLFSIKNHEQVCTNFNSLVDLVQNTFKDIHLLTYDIDLTENKTELKAYLSLGEQLGYPLINVLDAYNKALRKQKEVNLDLFINQKEKLKSKKRKILLAAHPYILREDILTKEIIDFIKNQDYELIYSNIIHDDIIDSECSKISCSVHWTHSKRLLAAISYYSNFVDGIIMLSCFPCGPDSLTHELVKRKINIPILNIILGNESDTGIITRLEAFFDIVKVKL